MIYGWGTDSVQKQLPDGKVALCRYRYLSLMFIFKHVVSRTYSLHTHDRREDREVSRQELVQTYGPAAVPSPGLWTRYGIALTGGVFVAALALSAGAQALFGSDDGNDQVEAGAAPIGQVLDGSAADGSTDGSSGDSAGGAIGAASTSSTAAVTEAAAPATAAQAGESADGMADTEPSSAFGAGSDLLASASDITLTSSRSYFSPNPDAPNQGTADMTIDRIYTTPRYADVVADPGMKLLVVEYELNMVTESSANVFDKSFRVVADDQYYQPGFINEVGQFAVVLNDVLIFTVPDTVMAFRLEAGPLPQQEEGLTATWDVTLSPDATAVDHLAAQLAVANAAIEAQASNVSRIAGTDLISPNPSQPQQGAAGFEVRSASTSEFADGEGSGARFKFLIVDWRLSGMSGSANVQPPMLRIEAGGERYSPTNFLNEIITSGEVLDGQAIFRIPRTAGDVTLTAGTVEAGDDGQAVYSITFS